MADVSPENKQRNADEVSEINWKIKLNVKIHLTMYWNHWSSICSGILIIALGYILEENGLAKHFKQNSTFQVFSPMKKKHPI